MAQLHPTAVHPRGQLSIPRPRGTSDASAQQRVGLLLPDKDSSTTRDQGPGLERQRGQCQRLDHRDIVIFFRKRTFY